MKNWRKKLEKIFGAVAFAEEGCHKMAMEYLADDTVKSKVTGFETFIEIVGLQGVDFSYGLAKI